MEVLFEGKITEKDLVHQILSDLPLGLVVFP